MADHVLLPMDGSDQSQHALEHALAEHADARITVLHVIDPARATYGAQAGIPPSSEEWFDAEEARAERLFEDVREQAQEAGVEVTTTTEVGQPSRVIVEYAEGHDVDHVVIGSHGRKGLSRVLLGSVAELVVRRSPVPVTVVR
jgi:nucleotide-binding universal stress UspA family protein